MLANSTVARADCWSDVESRYQVSRYLLLAIAQHESSLRADAINRNRDGTLDIGLMQINTRWLRTLRPYGIGVNELKNPCVNLNVGAWILANDFARYGNNWRAVGAYNATAEWRRAQYAAQVAAGYNKIIRFYGDDNQ